PQSPFPRYGLSVPAFPSHSGHMLLFGGLVHESVRNDLWSMDIRDCATTPVKTKGDAPIPRVGHASAIADRIMLVWGGDTKVRQEDAQDEGLYILDLRTQEWTSVPVGPGPIGRYGHAACMHETKFLVFGGQAEGSFMNDLWAYEVKQLQGAEKHKWERIPYTTPPPPRRTGHILLSYQSKLYLFGGTDGNYHYNDTWQFDMTTGVWTELSCIGYIPVPREGHAAAIVDDVIYCFGGRDVNGKDLGDLAAFRITNQRWYMFQNMGPAPTARSGHSMVAAHGKIYVLGGEANAASAQSRDDPSLVHVLDTSKIKYPADTQPRSTPKARTASDAPSQQAVSNNDRPGYPTRENSPPKQSQNNDTSRQIPLSESQDSFARTLSPSVSSDKLATVAQSQAPQPERGIPRSDSQDLAARAAPNGAGPPQRPRREGDDDFKAHPTRTMSPPNGVSRAMSPEVRAMSPNVMASPTQNTYPIRVTSPNGHGPASPPANGVKNGFNASVLGTRSPSPRLRQIEGERPAPPADAFYYGKSPTANGFGGRPGSVSSSGELMRELKARDEEIAAGKKREAAMRMILGKAIQQGFVADDGDDLPTGEEMKDNPLVQKLAEALLRLKQDKASIQIRLASEKTADAERLKRGAFQEAAFYRAKVATLESGSPIDLSRMEKERINELERQLAALAGEHTAAQRSLERAQDASSRDSQLHQAAVEREAETLKRAEDAEDAHAKIMEELNELHQKSSTADNALREHTERLITLSSVAQQREAERDQYQAQLEEATAARDEHVGLVEQAKSAIAAAGVRTAEMEALYSKANLRVTQLEDELADTKSELDARSRDAELATERLAEVENAYAKSREEADSLRSVTTSRLGEILDSHKEMRADEGRATRGHQEQLRALEEEGKSLRKMLKEAGQRVDTAEAGVSTHRQKARELESQHQTLRAEIRSHRTKLLSAQTELNKYKELGAAKDSELKDRDLAVTDIEMRCTMLRNLLADHGIAVDDNELNNAESSSSSSRELEAKLRERNRALENSQREVDELTRRCHDAEDRVESLGRLVDRMKDARSPTSPSMRSPTPPMDPNTDRRVAEVERRLQEQESAHRERLANLESDYQTAVRYVKGTEKMLKSMKNELTKQKNANASLQTEIDVLQGRSSAAGSRTRDASGRSTPLSAEIDLSRRLQTLTSQHNALQAELNASRDVSAAREREVDVLRRRVEEAEKEVENLREDLAQAQHRISTLLEMNQSGYQLGSEDEGEGEGERGFGRRDSTQSSEEASVAFDKLTKELKQWERSRSPPEHNAHALESEDDTIQHGKTIARGHVRNSSDYSGSGDWVQ
ncbi:hypothetical protein P7C73_g5552, partial [Tremellales sp. Uapishka_1]